MKKLLLLTYYWPPGGGASVLRWLRFCKYLPEYGWQPTVVTTRDGDYPHVDASQPEKPHPDVSLVRTDTPTFGGLWRRLTGSGSPLPYADFSVKSDDRLIRKLLVWGRINLVIPDMRVIWVPNAVRAAEQLLLTQHFDLLVTTGPPHSTHLTGWWLRKRFWIPWLADFRDPWTRISYMSLQRPGAFSRYANRLLERAVFRTAECVTMFSSHFLPSEATDAMELLNGYDPEEFDGLTYRRSDRFRVKYIGKLMDGRNILPVLEAMETLRTRHSIENMEFHFIGTFDRDQSEFLRVYPHIRFVPFASHRAALDEMVNSELLILLINRYVDEPGVIPLKLFEYTGSGTPVLGLGDPKGRSAQILQSHNAGEMIDYADQPAILWEIQQHYKQWQSGKTKSRPDDLQDLTISSQTAGLREKLNQLLHRRRRS